MTSFKRKKNYITRQIKKRMCQFIAWYRKKVFNQKNLQKLKLFKTKAKTKIKKEEKNQQKIRPFYYFWAGYPRSPPF